MGLKGIIWQSSLRENVHFLFHFLHTVDPLSNSTLEALELLFKSFYLQEPDLNALFHKLWKSYNYHPLLKMKKLGTEESHHLLNISQLNSGQPRQIGARTMLFAPIPSCLLGRWTPNCRRFILLAPELNYHRQQRRLHPSRFHLL
jgi:hypothetical protein